MAITVAHSPIMKIESPWIGRSLWIALLIGSATFWLSAQTRRDGLVGGDGLAYFLYARSMVVDLDTNLHNELESINEHLPPTSSVVWAVNDLARVDAARRAVELPWPIGAGLLYAPFYLVGLLVECARAAITGTSPDSYGWVVQVFFCLGSLIYGWLAFLLTVGLVRRIAPRPTAWIATGAVFFASPAMFYVFFHPSMSHAVSFALTAWLLVMWWPAWHEGASRPFRMGLCLGLLAIVRYQNALLGLLLVAVTLGELHRTGWRAASRFAAIGLLGCVLPLCLEAWHLQSVQVEPSPKVEVEDGVVQTDFQRLDLSSPNWLRALVSPRHGAFYWTPLLLLATIGLVVAAWRHGWARLALGVLAATLYLIGSIEQWWGGSSFGMRYLVELTPLFALGLATLLPTRSRWRDWRIWAPVLAIPVLWNAALALAYGLNTIEHSDPVTFAMMWQGVIEAIGVVI